jgi:hypothetical protein
MNDPMQRTKLDVAAYLKEHGIRFMVQRADGKPPRPLGSSGGTFLVVMQRGEEYTAQRLSFYMIRKHQPDVYEIVPFLMNAQRQRATALSTQIERFFAPDELIHLTNAYFR